MTTDERITREKEFHNNVYETKARKPLAGLYILSSPIRIKYRSLLLNNVIGKRILEYGCGLGSYGFLLASRGAKVSGIDISEYAIAEARRQARMKNLEIEFRVMNAESLDFSDKSFDLICGTGILHHLNIQQAVNEIQRVLKPGGKAVFIEPLGHNPLINVFRKLTPRLRSSDEHPLKKEDLNTLARGFRNHKFEFYYLIGLTALPFQKIKLLRNISLIFDSVDQKLFSMLPFLKRFAWQVLVELEQ